MTAKLYYIYAIKAIFVTGEAEVVSKVCIVRIGCRAVRLLPNQNICSPSLNRRRNPTSDPERSRSGERNR